MERENERSFCEKELENVSRKCFTFREKERENGVLLFKEREKGAFRAPF
jgi:hypothetical protein